MRTRKSSVGSGLGLLALIGLLSFAPTGAANAAPEVGKLAPRFLFEGQADGQARTYRSGDYVGESARKKGVVVAWFPKAFTPG